MSAGRHTKVGIGVLVVLGFAVLLCSLYLRPKMLLDRATRIPAASGGQCFWVSAHQVLLVRFTGRGDGEEALLIDTDKRVSRLLQPFTKHYGRFLMEEEMALSPDGKWLIWRGSKKHSDGWIVATLDAKHELIRQDKGQYAWLSFLWMPDSQHWLVITPQFVLIHSLQGKQTDRQVQLTGLTAFAHPIGVTPNGHLILEDNPPRAGTISPEHFLDCSLEGSKAACRPFSVPIPDTVGLFDIALSPQGDRLAWIRVKQSPVLLPLAWLGVRKPPELGIWVSDRDGGHLHEIGHILLDAGEQSWKRVISGDRPNSLRWTPDGKRLSFLYQNALWTVPAE